MASSRDECSGCHTVDHHTKRLSAIPAVHCSPLVHAALPVLGLGSECLKSCFCNKSSPENNKMWVDVLSQEMVRMESTGRFSPKPSPYDQALLMTGTVDDSE